MTHETHEWHRDGYTISTDPQRLDLEVIHGFLANDSYWAQGRSVETIRRSIEHSLAFGVYEGERQVGFCRVITDYATFAWLADVFVVEAYRGRGLAVWLVETVISHPELQGLKRWLLATKDAHGLYAKYGFEPLPEVDRWMTRLAGGR
ncbi:MAG TPA: GNAT family N-acetyltransferase [Chloroflexia bacterium]|jgi:GNAT superfamily N-acetyltransferase